MIWNWFTIFYVASEIGVILFVTFTVIIDNTQWFKDADNLLIKYYEVQANVDTEKFTKKEILVIVVSLITPFISAILVMGLLGIVIYQYVFMYKKCKKLEEQQYESKRIADDL